MKTIVRTVLTLTATLAITSAYANTITIGDSRDTTLYKNAADNANGQGVGMFAGQDPGGVNGIKHALIGFNIAGNVPAGSTITAVQLNLTLGMAAGGGMG